MRNAHFQTSSSETIFSKFGLHLVLFTELPNNLLKFLSLKTNGQPGPL